MMKIKVTGREVNAAQAKDEKLGRGELTETQVNGINAMADEAFDDLYYDFMSTDQSDIFEGYLGIVTYLADSEPAVALEIIGCMLKEREFENMLDEIRAFIPEKEAHVKAFARHFAIAGIMRKLEEEELEEELMEEMEEEDENPGGSSCMECMGASFGDCDCCRRKGAAKRYEQ